MPTFKNCKMDTYYRTGEEPWLDWPCDVSFNDNLITVMYHNDSDRVIYSGYEKIPGIYILKGSDNCDASLYGSFETKILYGGWKMPSSISSGLWTIRLGIQQ